MSKMFVTALSAFFIAVFLLSVLLDAPALAHPPAFPELISLPVGFGPEGIAVGNGATFYVGSVAASTLGQILVGDLRTGAVSQLVPPSGRPALGIKFDSRSNFIFVAGGGSGTGRVYDTTSGTQVVLFQFGQAGVSVINDVVLTREAAYFTDSQLPFLYRVALEQNGQLVNAPHQVIPLPANFGLPGGCTIGPPLRGNGIAATPNGNYLILMHMSEGRLYRMDTTTHAVIPIDLAGANVCSSDGMLLDGKTLYVVQNVLNRVAVIDIDASYLSGFVTRYITEPFASNPATRVPTTIAEFGNSLYAVTAGFAPPSPDYVVQLAK